MRRTFVVLALAFYACSVAAQDVASSLRDLHVAVRQKVLNLDSTSPSLLFPVLGKIPSWSSDVMVSNYRNVPQRVEFLWLQQGVNNGSRGILYYTLPANQVVYWHDFIGTALGTTGLGAVVIAGVDAAGNPDSLAMLDGSARLFTTNSQGGSLSQMFPAVPFHDVPSGANAVALGARSDSQFRLNVGVVNIDAAAQTFTAYVGGANAQTSVTVTVPPYSMMQVPVPHGNHGDAFVRFTSTSGNWWSAYAASVDNTSGDSWSAHAALTF